nr:uncharacterized protein LOC128706635 [Cherax quadricarinatus]XP_053657561.1 uncharacterized protein LOC128706635 [Cherax quadricarinatus]
MHSTLLLVICASLATSTLANLADYLGGSQTIGGVQGRRPVPSSLNAGNVGRLGSDVRSEAFEVTDSQRLTGTGSSVGGSSSTGNYRSDERGPFGRQNVQSVGSSGPSVGGRPGPRLSPDLGTAQGTSGTLASAGSTGASRFDQGSVRIGQAGSGPAPVRRVEFQVTPTVTKVVTVDHFITLTDLAFHSVAVTLTSLNVQTVTTSTLAVLHTPVNDHVALQSTVVLRPSYITVTCVKSDFSIVTEVSVDHVTITHTSYIIQQTTYTTTATQVLTLTSPLVRTIIRTARETLTDYRTVTDTVLAPGAYYGFGSVNL